MSGIDPRNLALMPDLFADLRGMTADQPPGVQAHIDREAATVRHELAERGIPITRLALQAYGVVLYQHGEQIISDHIDPTWSASWHGYRMAAIAQMWEAAP